MQQGFIMQDHLSNKQASTQTPKLYPCPQCQKMTTWQGNPHKPFCSARCKLIDLGAWASEDYKIPSNDAPFSDELDKF